MISPEFSFRHPTEADAQAVLDLMLRCDRADYGEGDSDMEDLLNDWGQVDLDRDAWLAFDHGGRLTGYSLVIPGSPFLQYDFWVDPGLPGSELCYELLDRCKQRGLELISPETPEGGWIGRHYVAHVNQRDRIVLEQAGFRLARSHFQMQRGLDGPIAVPEWPAGISIRSAVTGQDEPAIYALVQQAFRRPGRPDQPFIDWQAFMQREDIYDPSLWTLAFSGENLAGTCLGFIYPGMGWVRQLAVALPFRKQGLARALLVHAFQQFQQRGLDRVGLGVDAENPNAVGLYESVGMIRRRQYDEYHYKIQ